jgi:hypothetical protein
LDYTKVREQHANKKQTPLWTLAQARANKTPIDWSQGVPSAPKFIGRRVFKNYDLAELAQHIDWAPFFQTWDLAWRQVFQLAVGDTIKGLDVNKTIVSMEPIGIGPVVKMTVDRAHTYIAGGLISHNAKIIGGESLI